MQEAWWIWFLSFFPEKKPDRLAGLFELVGAQRNKSVSRPIRPALDGVGELGRVAAWIPRISFKEPSSKNRLGRQGQVFRPNVCRDEMPP